MSSEQAEIRESDATEPKVNFRMRMGNDYRFHFEDPELRKRGGDDYVFLGNEPGATDFMARTWIPAGQPV